MRGLDLVADLATALLVPPLLIIVLGRAAAWWRGRAATATDRVNAWELLRIWIVVGGVSIALWELVHT